MQQFRNIIFDLGGVIINLDLERTAAAFRRLGLTSFDAMYSQVRQSGLFDDFDKGLISPGAFREGLLQHLPAGTTAAQVDEAWNAMLLDVPPDRLVLLERLKKNYRTFLLSNTNEIHVTAFSASLQETFGFSDFSHLFEQCYYSCRIGMRKPDPEIFRYVLEQNRLDPHETIFIDDSPQHITGAAATGIHARFLAPGQDIRDADGPLRELLAGIS